MNRELEGKVALVTGGSRGIGRATALALARAGADVVIAYVSNEAAAHETLGAISAVGGRGEALRLDVSQSGAVKAALEGIVEAHGGLHVLVANAGVSIDGLLMRFGDDKLDQIFATNVFGAYYCARAAARPMMKARWGRLIFMGSVVGEGGNVGQSAYASTKSALDGLARSLAKELGSRGITANVVAAGYIETDMTRDLPEGARKKLIDSIPLGQMGQPEDVAEMVLFLASDRGRYITGQVLNVNGGMYM